MKTWENQYISLIKTQPNYIYRAENNGFLTSEDQSKFLSFINNSKKIFLEIGSGSGYHLVTRAKLDPNNSYIGLELRFKRVFKTAEKAEKENLTNLKVILFNAHKLKNLFSENSLDGIYINFPDPWEKEKWKKHRIINDEFLTIAFSLLKPNGFIAYKTDHQEYFQESTKLFESSTLFKTIEYSEDLYNSPYLINNVATEFEMLFRSKNQPVYYLKAIKN